ncbi:MAG: extracellular solute-binding protein, partial [Pseudomonadota bacterium]
MNLRKAFLFLACCICTASVASAQTEIAFWHALSGGLKDRLDAQVQAFNAAQTDYRVIATRKGNYGETLDAGIAAFETGSAPAILMVSDVDAPTLSATAGLTRSLHEILTAATPGFDDRIYINGVKAHFSTAEGDLQSLPYNTSTPVLWVNRDALISFG